MKTLKRTLIFSAGALSAVLMLSTPVIADEGKSARGGRGGSDRVVQAAGHRGHGRGPRSEYRGPRREAAGHRGNFRGPRGHYRQSHGYRHFKGQRHWRANRHWRRHQPYSRRHWHHGRYGHRYGYGYGYLGYGTSLVIRLH